MKLLALDAATEACSVALQVDQTVISRFEVCPQQHSKKLLPFVDEVLKEAGIALHQLDGIVYGQGPGSFTGVRIGVSIAQGLAFGADLPVVGVSSLATMAQQAIAQHQATSVLAAIDARMSEVYFCQFVNENGLAKATMQEIVSKPEVLTEMVTLDTDNKETMSVGTGFVTYADALSQQFTYQSTSIELPAAEFMLPLGRFAFEQGLAHEAENAQPNYVRDEVTWQKLPGR